MILKYSVEKSFKDKNTKQDILANSIIDVDIVRMKELNEKKIGKVVDVILNENIENTDQNTTIQLTQVKNDETEKQDDENKNLTTDTSKSDNKTEYTLEKLEEMTVNELKDLAEKIGCELKKAKKDEIIQEIIGFQEK